MKTLHLYLTRQVLATLLMTVAVFTFVLLIANALSEIMGLLVKGQATLGAVLEAFGLLIPFVLVFALPMGMLTAALLVFGRFSADHELTAVRSSGISLAALVSPILLLSLLLCGFSAWINMEVGPRCRVAYKKLFSEMVAKVGVAIVPEGRFVSLGSGYTVYVDRIDGTKLSDIHVYHSESNSLYFDQIITASLGNIQTTNGDIVVDLFNAHTLTLVEGSFIPSDGDSQVTFNPTQKNQIEGVSLSDMTMGQLQAQLRNLEKSFSIPDSRKLTRAELTTQKQRLEKEVRDLTMPVRVQIHREVATSFACFGFTLVGIPLGIRAHRRETNIGIVMALVLALFYYAFVILGQALRTHPGLAPHLIIWIPNFVFQAVGVVMLWRANRGI